MSLVGDAYFQDDLLGKVYDAQLMRRLAGYLAPYRRLVAVAFVGLLLLAITAVMPALLTRVLIDDAVAPAVGGSVTASEGLRRLLLFGAVYLAVLVGQAFLRYGQNLLVTTVGQRAMRDLRTHLFAHVESLSLSFFDRTPVGRLMTRLTNDVDALAALLTEGVISMLGDVLLLAGAAVVLVILDVRLALVTFCALPVVAVLTIFFRVRMRSSFVNQRIRLARINAYLNENLSGMAIVQLFTRERATFEAFDGLNDDHRQATRDAIRTNVTFTPLITLTRSATVAGIFIAGGYWVLDGSLTIGTLLAFWQLIDQFFSPIEDLSDKYNILQAAMASSERIFTILDTKPEVVDPPEPTVLSDVRGEVTFERVSFAYSGARWVLRDIDLRIAPGESVAIVGATGAGKTSIISLLSRFYDVQRGRILLDGVDIRSLRQSDLRRHVGVVLQDPFIFAGTIASNIRLRDASISDERVREAAAFVNAAWFIEAMPEAYDTVVTERGSMLSTGQKQLLAFARVVAFDPEIMLVLDEATSSIDTETERLIQDALPKLMHGRTSVLIAHRLSTIEHVQRIVVLHKGRIAEVGTHQELLAKRGAYHRLYELQYSAASTAAPKASTPARL